MVHASCCSSLYFHCQQIADVVNNTLDLLELLGKRNIQKYSAYTFCYAIKIGGFFASLKILGFCFLLDFFFWLVGIFLFCFVFFFPVSSKRGLFLPLTPTFPALLLLLSVCCSMLAFRYVWNKC